MAVMTSKTSNAPLREASFPRHRGHLSTPCSRNKFVLWTLLVPRKPAWEGRGSPFVPLSRTPLQNGDRPTKRLSRGQRWSLNRCCQRTDWKLGRNWEGLGGRSKEHFPPPHDFFRRLVAAVREKSRYFSITPCIVPTYGWTYGQSHQALSATIISLF